MTPEISERSFERGFGGLMELSAAFTSAPVSGNIAGGKEAA